MLRGCTLTLSAGGGMGGGGGGGMGGGGFEPPTKFSKRGGDLTGPKPLTGRLLEKRGVTFVRGVAVFTKKIN